MATRNYGNKMIGRWYRNIDRARLRKLQLLSALAILPLAMGNFIVTSIGLGDLSPFIKTLIFAGTSYYFLNKSIKYFFDMTIEDEYAFKRYKVKQESLDDFGHSKVLAVFNDGTERWVASPQRRSFQVETILH